MTLYKPTFLFFHTQDEYSCAPKAPVRYWGNHKSSPRKSIISVVGNYRGTAWMGWPQPLQNRRICS